MWGGPKRSRRRGTSNYDLLCGNKSWFLLKKKKHELTHLFIANATWDLEDAVMRGECLLSMCWLYSWWEISSFNIIAKCIAHLCATCAREKLWATVFFLSFFVIVFIDKLVISFINCQWIILAAGYYILIK